MKESLKPLKSFRSLDAQQLYTENKVLKNCNKILQNEVRNYKRQALKQVKMFFLLQEEERKEISRELHDEIGQILTAINLDLEVLKKETQGANEKLRTKIAHSQKLVEHSIEAIHHFARDLRPMILDDLGLLEALKSYVREYSRVYKINVVLKTQVREIYLGDVSKTVFYRVIQEALLNVAKHAQAHNVLIKISVKGIYVNLEIHDDGKSFNVRKVKSREATHRLGLMGMNERIKMVGGRLWIKSDQVSGTHIKAQIPLEPQLGTKNDIHSFEMRSHYEQSKD